MAFSRNPTGRSEQSDAQGLRRSPLTEATNTKTTGAAQGDKQMKSKARTALIIAGIAIAILIAGGIDNDYQSQRTTERESCSWITTPDGKSVCR